MKNLGIGAGWLCLWVASAAHAADAPAAAAAVTTTATKPAAAKAVATPKPAASGSDQLVLDPTLVSGNRELPKVMYIVPWKKADLSDLPGQPFNTLLDEALTPVDREVFQRQVKYYEVVSGKDRPEAVSDQQGSGQTTPVADRK